MVIVAYEADPNPDDFAIFMARYAPQYYSSLYDFIDYYGDHPDDARARKQSVAYMYDVYNALINIPMVGASGAIYGIIMAFGLLFPDLRLMLLFPPIPIKAKYFALILGGIAIYSEFAGGGDNVAHLAHLSERVFWMS